jgi:hypothetical protein
MSPFVVLLVCLRALSACRTPLAIYTGPVSAWMDRRATGGFEFSIPAQTCERSNRLRAPSPTIVGSTRTHCMLPVFFGHMLAAPLSRTQGHALRRAEPPHFTDPFGPGAKPSACLRSSRRSSQRLAAERLAADPPLLPQTPQSWFTNDDAPFRGLTSMTKGNYSEPRLGRSMPPIEQQAVILGKSENIGTLMRPSAWSENSVICWRVMADTMCQDIADTGYQLEEDRVRVAAATSPESGSTTRSRRRRSRAISSCSRWPRTSCGDANRSFDKLRTATRAAALPGARKVDADSAATPRAKMGEGWLPICHHEVDL